MSDEDREVVRRVQRGEVDAFEILVERYRRKVYRLAYQVLRDQEDALDVAQEAFVRAFRSLPRFKGQSAFYTWLFRITMNLALDRHRQRAQRARALGVGDVPPEDWERTAVSPEAGPDDRAASAERRARIARALDALSVPHRTIIILSDIEGLSYREIAEILQIPMGTVMSRLHHARRRLREALGPGFLACVLGALLATAVPAAPGPALGAAAPRAAPVAGAGAAARRPGEASEPPAAWTLTQGPGPGPSAPWGPPQVCVYALVLLASNAPAEAGLPPPARAPLTPTPPLRPPGAGPPARPAPGEPGEEGLEGWDEPLAPGRPCGLPVRVRPWVPRLREVFGYSNYEPVSAFESHMPLGLAQRFALPGGRELVVQPLAVRPPVVRMAVRIVRGGLTEVATVLDVPPRRPALIGGPPHGSGVLIIAIRSRPTP